MSKDSNYNSGDHNSGHDNSGNCNSGYCNSGHRNIGNHNSGNFNSGYRNSGNCNSGRYNSGYYNTGGHNSGYYNTGGHNSGHYNSGHNNSGHYNSGDYNSGLFNTEEPTVRMFNKDTGLKMDEIEIPYINLPLTEWVSEDKMTEEQKVSNLEYKTTGGFLLKRSYKEAWAVAWEELSLEDKNKFLNLPNFDPDIFEEITGINVRQKETCAGKVVEIDGKKYRLEEV